MNNKESFFYSRQNQPTSETPVVYHPVTSSTQVVTNGRRDNPPNYITISGSSNEGIPEPLLPYTQTTPSAPYEPSEETGGGVSLSEPGVNLDGYPPPPSYNEVVNDPEKFQTQSEHRETQAE